MSQIHVAWRFWLLATGFSLGLAGAAQAALTNDLQQLITWFSGEWNNNEQVWQQKIDAADVKLLVKQDSVAHVHEVAAPLKLPLLGEHVFYVQQSSGLERTEIKSQRLLRFTVDTAAQAIRQESFELKEPSRFVNLHLKPAEQAALKSEDLIAAPISCAMYWRYDATLKTFNGASQPGQCTDKVLRQGQDLVVYHSSTLNSTFHSSLSQTKDAGGQVLQGNRTDTAVRSRKARYFEGWLWFRNAGPSSLPEDKNISFTAKYLMHSEGQRMPVLFQDGSPSPYLIELATLTYQNTRKPVLKFTLMDSATLKTLTYVWANADAHTLGMNLGWFQAGVAQKSNHIYEGSK
ncbi:MAG: chromophore lyase CpcT/CpeT [Limnohabitans sp.]